MNVAPQTVKVSKDDLIEIDGIKFSAEWLHAMCTLRVGDAFIILEREDKRLGITQVGWFQSSEQVPSDPKPVAVCDYKGDVEMASWNEQNKQWITREGDRFGREAFVEWCVLFPKRKIELKIEEMNKKS